MPKTVSARIKNPLESSQGKVYFADYASRTPASSDLQANLELQWSLYNPSSGPNAGLEFWHRPAADQPRVEVTFLMPRDSANISGLYRVEVFIPDRFASGVARYTVTVQDENGALVDRTAFIDQNFYMNAWVTLGQFRLEVGSPTADKRLGQVRQYDETSQANPVNLQLSFGPVRWVPLYQTPDPLYTRVDDTGFAISYNGSRPAALQATRWVLDETGSVEQPLDNSRQIIWGPARWRRSSQDISFQQVRVDYQMPAATSSGAALPDGRYRIEAFIPFRLFGNVLCPQVRYLVQNTGGPATEVTLDQQANVGRWAQLGEFDLHFSQAAAAPAGTPPLGQVSQFDDSPVNAIVSFGTVRWTPLFEQAFEPGKVFSYPVGSPAQRAAPIVPSSRLAPGRVNVTNFWLDDWYDENPFLSDYFLGLHTGADLNFALGSGLHMPVFAVADGRITFARKVQGGSWNYVIVIEHPAAFLNKDGRVIQHKVYSRYGHVHKDSLDLPNVKEGGLVKGGEQIGFVGFMRDISTGQDATQGEHLHFDVCFTNTLASNPIYWPTMKDLATMYQARKTATPDYQNLRAKVAALVQQDFVDPLQFIIDNHSRSAEETAGPADNGLFAPDALLYDFPVGEDAQRQADVYTRLEQFKNGLYSVGAENWYLGRDFLSTAPDGLLMPGVSLGLANGAAGEKTVCAPAEGQVIFCNPLALGPFPASGVVVIRHPRGVACRQAGSGVQKTIYTRLGGLASIFVHAGQQVQRGDPLGALATPQNGRPDTWRLQFFVSDTQVLEDPAHWPAQADLLKMIHTKVPKGSDPSRPAYDQALKAARDAAQAEAAQDYLHPMQFITDNHPAAQVLQLWRSPGL